jgi:hypothetical protein
LYSCKRRGVIKKQRVYAQKEQKKCAPIKGHRKKLRHEPPSKIKERGQSQSQEYLEKQTNIFNTLAHLNQVA